MPEAILLQDVDTLGEQGSVVDVSKGYLRNYLLPRKLAQPATRGAVEAIRERQPQRRRSATRSNAPRTTSTCSIARFSRSPSRPVPTGACSGR
jgi:large subunit ribosomal protein L9